MSVAAAGGPRLLVEGHERRTLDDGWEAARTAPGEHPDCSRLDQLGWWSASVPGTAAAVLRGAGLWRLGEPSDLDADDWWFRSRFSAEPPAPGEELVLVLEGLATVAEVYLNGRRVLDSESMFIAHELDVGGSLCELNELAICCRALGPRLAVRRRPRARWRTRVAPGALRFHRTMIIGRAPGFAPGPAAVGPWRPVRLERRRRVAVDELVLRPSLQEDDGVLAVRGAVRPLGGASLEQAVVELNGPSGTHRVALSVVGGADGARLSGRLRVPAVARWWPHTHGEPVLHEVRLDLVVGHEAVAVEAGRVGFRELAGGPPSCGRPVADPARTGLDLHINGLRVFARGAVWTPLDPVGLAVEERTLRAALVSVRDAGMNMLRVVGTGAYESPVFHDLCDELGVLVWQDFMFANFDYPAADGEFRALVEREAVQALAAVGGRASLTVLCGNSEVEQQVAMLGLDPAIGCGELFSELLPGLIEAAGLDVPYLPSAPCGGDLPFRTDAGVANYFGVGAYRRPLEDARRAQVRFASECLAFANVPDEQVVAELAASAPGGVPPHHPRWKAGVPRDVGSGWDFEDVRDHYLALCFDVDPVGLRSVDPARYLELSRAVSGHVMAEVFGEWRRSGSPCGGGLVLWLRDLMPGAGWGVLDYRGAPKVAYHHLRRALAPQAVWMTDEGLNGVDVHVANDRPTPLRAELRVSLYRDLEQLVGEARSTVELAPHDTVRHGLEALLGRFVDASWSYRFGSPPHDAIVASLERRGGGRPALLSQCVRFPAGAPVQPQAPEQLGLVAAARVLPGGVVELALSSRRLAHGVRIHMAGFSAEDDAFTIEPGGARQVRLTPLGITGREQAAHRSPGDAGDGARGAHGGAARGGSAGAAQGGGAGGDDHRGGSGEGTEGATAPSGTLTALNLAGRVPIELVTDA